VPGEQDPIVVHIGCGNRLPCGRDTRSNAIRTCIAESNTVHLQSCRQSNTIMSPIMKVAFLTHAEGAHLGAYFSALAAAKDCDEVVLADPDQRWTGDAKKVLGEKLTRTYVDYAELLQKESPKLCMV
jgi:hypothetical protein